MSHSVRHTHTHGSLTHSFIHRSFLPEEANLSEGTCYMHQTGTLFRPLSLFFSPSSVSPVHGPPRPRARLQPQEVGWGSQQGPTLRHTISMRELESLRLEGQRRTSPSLCTGGRRFGKLCEGGNRQSGKLYC